MPRTFNEVEDLPILSLDLPGPMAGRIPLGEVTMIAGEGGCGKGQTAVWLASEVSNMGYDVVMVTPEDDVNTTVGPRLSAAGAQRGRILDLTTLDSGARFLLSADGKTVGSVGALRSVIDNPEYRVKLVIIDPILSCIGWGSISTNKGARTLLEPLFQMAKETGIAIVLTHHTVLGPNGKPKVAGSKGLTDALRLVYMAMRDPWNPALRILSCDPGNGGKSNGAPTDDVKFCLQRASNGFTYVQFLDNDELIMRRTKWRIDAEKLALAGQELGEKNTDAKGIEVGAVPPPPVAAKRAANLAEAVEASDVDLDADTDEAMEARIEALRERLGY